jgi:enamine deaminase RidA (YjgF/YER057c/UK114 family)
VLKEAGMSLSNVVSAQAYLTDRALFDRMNSLRSRGRLLTLSISP